MDEKTRALLKDWDELSHRDDWNVPCVYVHDARELVARELERLVAEHERRNENSVIDLAMRLRARASVLRGEGQTDA